MALKKLLNLGIALTLGGLSMPIRAAEPLTHAAKITLDDAGVLIIDGKKVFPINVTVVPGPDAKAPSGKQAYAQFADDGVVFMRSGGASWSEAEIEKEKAIQAAAAAGGMRCCPWLGWELSNFDPGDEKKTEELARIVETFRDSPGMGMWKGADEPEWGNEHDSKKSTPAQVDNVARIIHKLDPNHPIWLVQAPRGTVPSLKRYVNGWDVGGIDVYPISYPPGVHSEEKNKEMSMVGDFTRMMRAAAGGKPYWMTLQIAFSGTVKPGQTLRMPTFPEQRFCAYEAIINGSRGLTYFGGGLPQTLNKHDQPFGFNWTYWEKIMKPLLEEIGPRSPIQPVLVAADSKIKLHVMPDTPKKRKRSTKAEENKAGPQEKTQYVQDQATGEARQIEFLVREVGNDVYVLACKKEGPTAYVKFSGLPADCKTGEVVFEEPRTVTAEEGAFSDWFGPFEVHVYKFTRG